MNIVIVGPGAIGSLWAFHLSQAGHSVSVWLRQPEPQFIVQLDDHPKLPLPHNNRNDLENADLVLVTTKVWQVKSALSPIIPYLSSDTIILLMHNGMGVVDELQTELATFPFLIATTTHGAKKEGTKINHTGIGSTQIGALNEKGKQCSFLEEVLQHTLPDVTWNSEINNALWLKLIINCVINPLTALEQCKNGALNDDRFTLVIDKLVRELVSVAQAEGIDFEVETITAQIYQVISSTAENRSSMHQDIYYKRKTEIDFITGYLLKCADRHQISIPENRHLYQQIKQIEPRTLS
ncbi:2-dehydropantoate 2-reductase [Vibrio sp. RC27]